VLPRFKSAAEIPFHISIQYVVWGYEAEKGPKFIETIATTRSQKTEYLYLILLKNPGVWQNSLKVAALKPLPGGPIVQWRPNKEARLFRAPLPKRVFQRNQYFRHGPRSRPRSRADDIMLYVAGRRNFGKRIE